MPSVRRIQLGPGLSAVFAGKLFDLDTPRKALDHLVRGVTDAQTTVIAAIQDSGEHAKPYPLHDTGELLNSFAPTPVQITGTQVEGVVGTQLPYALVMEEGRTPGKRPPPVGPIRLWAQRKFGGAIRAVRGLATARGFSDLGRRTVAEGLAFVIARSIGRKGIQARHFVRNALVAVDAEVRFILSSAVEDYTREWGGR